MVNPHVNGHKEKHVYLFVGSQICKMPRNKQKTKVNPNLAVVKCTGECNAFP